MSQRRAAKEARRRKRRAARDASWIAEPVLEDVIDNLEFADVLEVFDEQVTERGWVFSDEFSDEESALWFYPPSLTDLSDDNDAPVTTLVMYADDDAEIAHVLFVGTHDGYPFAIDELFDHLDVIEAYRFGDPLPEFSD